MKKFFRSLVRIAITSFLAAILNLCSTQFACSEDLTDEQIVSFVNDIVPIFSRYGCNSGRCHGAARGKDGFALSLFGFDPAGDYRALTRERPGRRIDMAMPRESLLLAKATGTVPHTGGKLFDETSQHYGQLLKWISGSANFDGDVAAKVVRIEVSPSQIVMNGQKQHCQLKVVALYDDQTERDVTGLAAFSSNNPEIASVSKTGKIVGLADGEAFVMARYDVHTVGNSVIVHADHNSFEWPADVVAENAIDQAVYDKLKKLHIAPAPICSDAEFLRRISIDLAGRLPTSAEVNAFVEDRHPNKRAAVVDKYLAPSDFERIWTMKWLELLKVRTTNRVSDKANWKFAQWLKVQIGSGVPIDQWLTTMLTALGGEYSNPPVTYFRDLPNTKLVAEDVAQVFLGMRIQCAQCHNHPFDRWTMDDYYGFVAFFEKVRRKRGTDPRERIVFSAGGKTVHPVTKERVAPKFLGGEAPDLNGVGRRAVLAKWITSKDNPYFARNLANRIWEHFFGVGIVDEVDDIRASNPPVNEALLSNLAERMIETDFDFKSVAREICISDTYQRSTVSNQTSLLQDTRNFARARLRRIRAEVLLDVIAQVTETENDYVGLPVGSSATEIADGKTSSHFLRTFGRSNRTTVCSCEIKTEPNLSQALHLINGDTVHQKILDGKVIDRMVDAQLSNREIIEELYLRCLARRPTKNEHDAFATELFVAADRKQALRDVFWALLNSREFLFNH